MRTCYFLFSSLLLLSFSVTRAKEREKPKKTGYSLIEKTLEHYNSKSFTLKVKQEIFLTSIKESIESSGSLNKKGNRFQLELKGEPSSSFLFDGKFLWYQPDTSEKLVFQFQNHPQIHLLNGFFSAKKFFELFEIGNRKQKKQTHIIQLFPKEEIKGLKEIFMKINSHILEVRIIWEDLNNWQKLSFSKPIYKSFPKNFFQFSKEGFQVIQKDQ